MAHDRAQGDTYPMTHEFLAMMLGVRRAGVSVAAGVLQKAELISYSTGRMAITDRPGLESASCECYGKNCLPDGTGLGLDHVECRHQAATTFCELGADGEQAAG